MTSNDIIESLNQLRLQNTGCDVILQIGAKAFPAHRVVLMARMEHFRNMFTADMREKKELTVQFDPLIIDPNFFGDFLDYTYTLKIDFTNENIRAIYKAADYFCFDELINKVKDYMKSSLKLENAILYRNMISEFDLESLRNACEQFIIDNLSSDVIKSQLIPTLSFEKLKDLNDKLKEYEKFEEMFNCSIEWILYDKPNRTGMLLELLKNIPLESLSFRFLKQNASKHEIVMKDIDCLTLLFNAVITISEPLHSSSIIRKNKAQLESLYAIGGRDGQILSSVSEYNNRTREWTATTPMPYPRSYFGCAVISLEIYVCGGFDKRQTTNALTVFDTYSRTWTQLTPMKHERYNCSAAVLNGQIYVAGGWNSFNTLAVVERYCVETGQWSDVASMLTKRSGLELVALNGSLYAIGGRDDNNQLDIVERYDPKTNKWSPMSNTNYKYNLFGSAVLNEHIYIAGTETCEVYSPAYNKWTEMPAPSKCGFGRRLTVYDGRLYAIGGAIGSTGSKTVEVYDMQARVWRPEPDMDVGRFFHSVAVVKT